MIRDEQITKALSKLLPQGQYTQRELELASGGFTTGAKWADANPNWHLCSENMPDNFSDENKEYLIYTDLGYITTARFGYIRNEYSSGGIYGFIYGNCTTDIIAWMELPKPPKFD